MDKSFFTQPGPMLSEDDSFGSEPTLREIIIHYYFSHGITLNKATELADAYIAECGKEANE